MSSAVIGELVKFLSFPTTAENPGACRDCLQWIASEFLSSSRGSCQFGEVDDAPYFYLEHTSPELVWFGHVDVIAPEGNSDLQIDQTTGRLFGRGVKDMKGSAIPFLLAYRDLCSRGLVPKVSILFTSDEERAGHSVERLIDDGVVRGPVAFSPDTGETPHIIVEQKGMIWADVVASGLPAHAATPWKGINAFDLILQTIDRLNDRFGQSSDDRWEMTVCVGTARAEGSYNRVPDRATCTLDIRVPAEIGIAEAIRTVENELVDGCRLEVVRIAHPLRIDPEHSMVRQLQAIAKDVLDAEVAVAREHGASSACHFAQRGIPAFLYGPIGGGHHSPREWVSLQSLNQHLEINLQQLKLLT